MAWMAEVNYYAKQPELVIDPDDEAYIDEQNREGKNSLIRERKIPWEPMSPFSSGFNIPFRDRPIRFSLPTLKKGSEKNIPQIMNMKYGWLVPDYFIEAIEKIEPNVHRYWDVDLFGGDGNQLSTKRWILESMSWIDSLDISRSKLTVLQTDFLDPERPPIMYRFDRPLISAGTPLEKRKETPAPIFCKKSVTKGRALWSEQYLAGARFFSDELVDALQSTKLGRLQFNFYVPEV